ncbi:MAG: PorV/PorQ family protein [Candidatus Marinimicrobia bacterium]|nr:PorV/PorQ family protein [Candidatus Neomarinimicrobiota bacterium]
MIRKQIHLKSCFITFLLVSIITGLYGEDKKLGQTGFQFLSVTNDARSSALGNAATTLENGVNSLFFNPAGMARLDKTLEFTASQNEWIDNIQHNTYALAFRPYGGRIGVFGITAQSVDYGEVQGTMAWQNEQGFIDTELMYPSAFSGGIGYAIALSDKFSVGGSVKYSGQQLGKSIVPKGDSLVVKKNKTYATSLDFGTQFKTGYKSLMFGMTFQNFSQEIHYERENFQLPLTFTIGITMDLLDLMPEKPKGQELWAYVDATHPRSYPEQVNLGLEYAFMKTFFLRGGYMFVSDEQDITFGVGIQKFGFSFNYSYTPFGVFDYVQRFTLGFTF